MKPDRDELVRIANKVFPWPCAEATRDAAVKAMQEAVDLAVAQTIERCAKPLRLLLAWNDDPAAAYKLDEAVKLADALLRALPHEPVESQDREALAKEMLDRAIATGHGDTIADLIDGTEKRSMTSRYDLEQIISEAVAETLSQCAQDKADAERYRWLCVERAGWFSRFAPDFNPLKPKMKRKECLDAAIDAARALPRDEKEG